MHCRQRCCGAFAPTQSNLSADVQSARSTSRFKQQRAGAGSSRYPADARDLRMKDRMLSTFSRLAARVGWRDVDEESPLDADDDASDDIRQHHSRRATQTESHLLQGELLLKESDSLRYLLRRPSLLSQSRPALLCFLHDVDQAAPAEPVRALTRHGPFACSGSPFLERFVVVAPQLPCSADAWCLYASAMRRSWSTKQCDTSATLRRFS